MSLQWRKISGEVRRSILKSLDSLAKRHGIAVVALACSRYNGLYRERMKRQRLIDETQAELDALKSKR